MAAPAFELERLRREAGLGLPASCVDDFQRLSRTLIYGPAFQWLLVDAPHEGLRRQVMQALDKVLRAAKLQVNRLPLSQSIADMATLERRLVNNAGKAEVVHVIGPPGWFDAARWDAFNARRERIAAQAKARLVFWLDAPAIALVSSGAADLWAWRAGVYAFLPESQDTTVSKPLDGVVAAMTSASFLSSPEGLNATTARAADIQNWIRRHPGIPDDMLAAVLGELGRRLFESGDLDGALAHWREVELPLHERMTNVKGAAGVQGQIADVLTLRGEWTQALKIRQEIELPLYESLGDMRSAAVVRTEVADLLASQGHLTEALDLLRKDALPVLQQLGAVFEQRSAQRKMAFILFQQGDASGALQLLREQVLPGFASMDDQASMAATYDVIADILRHQGQIDEALRIYRSEVVAIYERLGRTRERAHTLAKMAYILNSRGQASEARALLRLARNDLLQLGLPQDRQMAQSLPSIADPP